MEHKYKFFSCIAAGFTAAVVGTFAVIGASALEITDPLELWKNATQYGITVQDSIIDTAQDWRQSVFDSFFGGRSDWQTDGATGHGGAGHSRTDSITNAFESANGLDSFTIPTITDMQFKAYCEYTDGSPSESFSLYVHLDSRAVVGALSDDSYIIMSRRDEDGILSRSCMWFATGSASYYDSYRTITFRVANSVTASTTYSMSVHTLKKWTTASGFNTVKTTLASPPSDLNAPADLLWTAVASGTNGSTTGLQNVFYGAPSGTVQQYTDIPAGTVVNENNANAFGFAYIDSLLSFDGSLFDSLLDGICDEVVLDFSEIYDNMPEPGVSFTDTDNYISYQTVYNDYIAVPVPEPLPPGTGGVPDAWLNLYPTVTTAWSIEPYGGTYPDVTLPTLANPVVTGVTDLFDISGLAPLALTLVTVGIVLSLL